MNFNNKETKVLLIYGKPRWGYTYIIFKNFQKFEFSKTNEFKFYSDESGALSTTQSEAKRNEKAS
jgi:hypothetical protein